MQKKLYFDISDFGGRFSDTDDCPVAQLLGRDGIKTIGVSYTMFSTGFKAGDTMFIDKVYKFKTHYRKSLLFGLIKFWKTVNGFNLADYFYVSEQIHKNPEYKAYITYNTK